MKYVLAAMLVSFLTTLAIIRLRLAGSLPPPAIVPDEETPEGEARLVGLGRAGGIGVVAGLLASMGLRLLDRAPFAESIALLGLTLLGCAAPVFLVGLLEDLTQRMGVALRLAMALVSAALAGWFLSAWVTRIGVAGVDIIFSSPVMSVVVTCLLVAGITHAFNIIDGFNGLAAGVASLILLGTAYVAFKVGDVQILAAALTALGAIVGFMLLNFPRGLIFLGDGGAYLIGFWIGVLQVLLVARNPAVSPWFPALLCCYPACELLFTIYRRGLIRHSHPGLPDLAHLHHLIYMRLVRWLVGAALPHHKTQRNALTAPYLWIIASIGVAPAVAFWKNTWVLAAGVFVFAAGYVYAYVSIVRFRSPRWWILHRSSSPGEDRSEPH